VTHVIRINGISKRFDRIQALNSVSFDVPQHSIFGLLGPNGAGKTTLFSIVANFLKADAGHVQVLGADTSHISKLQGRLTILPQDAAFQRNVPILKQLVFFRLLDGRARKEAEEEVRHTLDLVGLESMAKRRVGSLSHGMIKRLGIAQAFLGHPEVILLDEPTSGLDPASVRQIRDLIKQLRESATIVISSHNLDEIQELCDHVAILDHGKLVVAGSVDVITQAGRQYELALSRPLTSGELRKLQTLDGVRDIQGTESANYLVTLDLTEGKLDLDQVLAALLRSLLDLDITPRRVSAGRSLEAHFLEVTGGDGE
jgi:ABC-type multidrug transport system ATPase subunit